MGAKEGDLDGGPLPNPGVGLREFVEPTSEEFLDSSEWASLELLN